MKYLLNTNAVSSVFAIIVALVSKMKQGQLTAPGLINPLVLLEEVPEVRFPIRDHPQEVIKFGIRSPRSAHKCGGVSRTFLKFRTYYKFQELNGRSKKIILKELWML